MLSRVPAITTSSSSARLLLRHFPAALVVLAQGWSFAFLHRNAVRFVGSVPGFLKVPLNENPAVPCPLFPLARCHVQTCRGRFVSGRVTDGVEQDEPSWYCDRCQLDTEWFTLFLWTVFYTKNNVFVMSQVRGNSWTLTWASCSALLHHPGLHSGCYLCWM